MDFAGRAISRASWTVRYEVEKVERSSLADADFSGETVL